MGYSRWSDTFRLQTLVQGIDLMQITSAENKATLTWKITDTSNFTNLKWVYIYRDSVPSVSTLIDSVTCSTINYIDVVKGLDVKYYYSLRLVNNQYVMGPNSLTRSVAILDTIRLSSPADSLLSVSLNYNLSWNKNRYYQKFRLDVSRDRNFNNLEFQKIIYTDSTGCDFKFNNTWYYWRVRAEDSTGYGTWSRIRTFQTELTAPKFDSIVAGNKKLKLYWSPADTNEIDYFHIYRDTSKSNPAFIAKINYIGNVGYALTDNKLVNDKKYYYWLSAINKQGVESDLSEFEMSMPYNSRPIAVTMNDTILPNIGRVTRSKFVLSQEKAIDLDGKIDSIVWYINDLKVAFDTVLAYRFAQGTNHVKAIVYDDDLDSDTAECTVTQMMFVKKFRSGFLAGLSAFDKNSIYLADTSVNPFGYGEVFKIDSNGKQSFNILLTQRIRTTPSIDYKGNLYVTNGPLLNSFTSTGAPLCNEINLGGLCTVTPTIDSILGRLYVGITNRKFISIDIDNNCKINWDFTADAPLSSSAIITAGRKLIFTDVLGQLYGFDVTYSNKPKTGDAPMWKYSTGDSIVLAPAVDSLDQIIVGTKTGKVIKLNLDSSGTVSVIWSKKVGNVVTASPVIDGYGRVYIVADNGKLIKLSSITGDSLGSRDIGSRVVSTPVISDENRIYLADISGKITVVDTALKTVWKYLGDEPIVANLLTIDGATYAPTLKGNVLAFYDKNLNVRDTAVRGAVTRRGGKKIAPQPKPRWGAYQGNYRRTGMQDSRFVPIPTRKVSDNDVLGFPNPTDGNYRVQSKVLISKIEVYDLKGNLQYSKFENNVAQVSLNLSNLNSGIYLIRIETVGGTVVKRVMVQKQ